MRERGSARPERAGHAGRRASTKRCTKRPVRPRTADRGLVMFMHTDIKSPNYLYITRSNATIAAALELLAVARATVRYTDTITVQHRPLCHELATRSPMANCCSMASMTISASAPSASSASRRLQV